MARRTAHSRHQATHAAASKNRTNLWVVGALLLAVLSVTVFLNGLSADRGDDGGRDREALEQEIAASSAPTAAEEAEDIEASLAGIVEDISAEFGVQTGATMRAGGGIVHAGELQDIPALSSIKVPVSVAAVQDKLLTGAPVEEQDADIDAALTRSDNDAALRLWESLGSDEESAVAVGGVLSQAGDPTDTLRDRDLDTYEGFGDITWSLDHQVIFANLLACLNGAEQPLDAMGRLVDEHRGGLGQLPEARVKGGWGYDADDQFILREFGLAGPAQAQVPLAVAVIPEDGQEETARKAVGEMARRLAPVVDEASATGGDADCQAVAG
ncbi:hypothetical protein [Candidatus Corynebacterium faecigallinarum]|uniref:hypothetical protein n=1 Tax=Candidatus Corynebacterium faecigallinarum TaxID=2838528 RepID=UPI003FD2A873